MANSYTSIFIHIIFSTHNRDIEHQEKHHRIKSFQEEYLSFLKKNIILNMMKNMFGGEFSRPYGTQVFVFARSRH